MIVIPIVVAVSQAYMLLKLTLASSGICRRSLRSAGYELFSNPILQ